MYGPTESIGITTGTLNEMDNLKDYIVVLKNIVPKETIDIVLQEYKDSDEWTKSTVESNQINVKTRNCDVINISSPEVIQNSLHRQQIDNIVFESVKTCIKKFNDIFEHSHVAEDTGYQLLRYNIGQFYKQHTDSFILEPRLVTASIHLNENYEGGEFAFFYRKLKYKLNKGDVLMFPSTFMYPHEIMPVTKGTRYSITTWFR